MKQGLPNLSPVSQRETHLNQINRWGSTPRKLAQVWHLTPLKLPQLGHLTPLKLPQLGHLKRFNPTHWASGLLTPMRHLQGFTRDFFQFFVKETVLAGFQATPLMDQLPTVQVNEGKFLGQGVEKRVFMGTIADTASGQPKDVVILKRRWPWTVKMAEGELRGLGWFKRHGFPVVKTVGKTVTHGIWGYPALVQERMAAGAKEVIKHYQQRDHRALLASPITPKTLSMLDEVIQKLRPLRYALPDLQVLIAHDGGIAFNDVLEPQPQAQPVTDVDLRFLLDLRKAAAYTLDLRKNGSSVVQGSAR